VSTEYVFQSELTENEISATGLVGNKERLFWVLCNRIDPHPTRGGIYNRKTILTDTAGLQSLLQAGTLKNPKAVPPGLLP